MKMISSFFAPHSSVWNEKYVKYIFALSLSEVMELQRVWMLLIVHNM